LAQLLDDTYLKGRAAEVNPNTPTPLANVTPGLGTAPIQPVSNDEKPQTTHFSIVDKWGNAAAQTYTINGGFGSGVVVKGAGFLLNDEMDDFSAKPGVPNQFGVVGGDVNSIQPNKRPLSSMSPTIAVKDGKVTLVLGTPGGSRIFTGVYQVLIDVLDYKLPLDQAQAQPRFHHQLLPDNVIYYEASKFPAPVATDLTARGWKMQDGLGGGDNIQAIQIVGTTPVPVSDPRNPDGVSLVVPPVNTH
jgi:gamma-glutamyltranspeptidase/glutathione hydrolase